MRQNTQAENNRGLSIIELLVGISILTILISYSVPSLTAIMSRTSIRATQDILLQDIRQSRIEAKTNRTVAYLCPSEDGVTCMNSNQWHQGWISYLDVNNNQQYDGVDTLITLYQPTPRLSITVSLNAAGRAKAIKIDPYGTIRTSGNLRICNPDSNVSQINTIKLNNQGRLAREKRNLPCT